MVRTIHVKLRQRTSLKETLNVSQGKSPAPCAGIAIQCVRVYMKMKEHVGAYAALELRIDKQNRCFYR